MEWGLREHCAIASSEIENVGIEGVASTSPDNTKKICKFKVFNFKRQTTDGIHLLISHNFSIYPNSFEQPDLPNSKALSSKAATASLQNCRTANSLCLSNNLHLTDVLFNLSSG